MINNRPKVDFITPRLSNLNPPLKTLLIHYKFSAGLVGDDIFNWEVIIIGPPETLFEGNYFIEKLFIYK